MESFSTIGEQASKKFKVSSPTYFFKSDIKLSLDNGPVAIIVYSLGLITSTSS